MALTVGRMATEGTASTMSSVADSRTDASDATTICSGSATPGR